MAKALRLGTRPSALAIKQAWEIQGLLPDIHTEIVLIKTSGDVDKVSPLSGKERSDFFTRQIEEALFGGRIDAGVHSAKDLEKDLPCGLIIAVMTRSISPRECLASRGGIPLERLPPGAIIGTSSQKRKEAIRRFRPDLAVKDIRGNIDERLAQLDEGAFDAIIVAHAALIRLGYEDRIAQIIPEEMMAPHPLQGRIAIQVRRERQDLIDIFGGINGS